MFNFNKELYSLQDKDGNLIEDDGNINIYLNEDNAKEHCSYLNTELEVEYKVVRVKVVVKEVK